MNKFIKNALIVTFIFFLNLFIIWSATFILSKNLFDIIEMPVAGVLLLLTYFVYGLILTIINKTCFHLKTVAFLLLFYLSLCIYTLFALNAFGALPFIKHIQLFDVQNILIQLHNIDNDPLGIVIILPVNLLILFFATSISYLATSFLCFQFNKTMKEINS